MSKLQVADAAVALDIPAKSLRKIVDQLTLPTVRRQKGDIATFGDFDLCFLKLVASLVNHGISIKVSGGLAQAAYEIAAVEPTDDPIAAWQGKVIVVTRAQQGWQVAVWADEDEAYWPVALIFRPVPVFSEIIARANERRAA